MASREKSGASGTRGKNAITGKCATGARYDSHLKQVIVTLDSGFQFLLDPKRTQGLQEANEASLRQIRIIGPGLGLYFPKLDVDVHVPSLLEGHLGSKKWAAAQIGRAGGRARTTIKSAASRRNGKLGGRPRRHQVDA